MSEDSVKQGSYGRAIGLSIVGFLIGSPLSYFFQTPVVRQKVPFEKYAFTALGHLFESVSRDERALLGDTKAPILITCIVCAVILGVIGYMTDPANKRSV